MVKSFEYPCVAVQQGTAGKNILLFSASATEIDSWVGIPQRLSLSGAETAGFQRTVSSSREKALRKFFAEPLNVIQNPLLCAIRQAPGIRVTFNPDEADPRLGRVMIEVQDFEEMTWQELLHAARTYLEERVPHLAARELPTDLILELQGDVNSSDAATGDDEEVGGDEEGDGQEPADADDEALAEPAEEALFDESQITAFWDQLRAREELAKKLTPEEMGKDLQGFSREMLISYLRPIILVDGQHRLRGAILAAQDAANKSEEAENLVSEGMSADEARSAVIAKIVRTLPVSLLMDDSPAEHVFQYVLVNQKATPVPKALLGTIISTSLDKDELEAIAHRLEDAKIQLEGSRIISILTRSADSASAFEHFKLDFEDKVTAAGNSFGDEDQYFFDQILQSKHARTEFEFNKDSLKLSDEASETLFQWAFSKSRKGSNENVFKKAEDIRAWQALSKYDIDNSTNFAAQLDVENPGDAPTIRSLVNQRGQHEEQMSPLQTLASLVETFEKLPAANLLSQAEMLEPILKQVRDSANGFLDMIHGKESTAEAA